DARTLRPPGGAVRSGSRGARRHRKPPSTKPARDDIEKPGRTLAVQQAYAADLELARACEAGDGKAWEKFILTYRPILYRSADALDPTGGARDLADAIYGELFERSLFRYFQGRSSLATWLRAVLSQRYVDRLRGDRRTAALPEDESAAAIPAR